MPNVTVSVFDDVAEWAQQFDKIELKSEDPMVFKDDPVAMAVAVHRTHCEYPARGDRWARLESAEISEQDRRTSAEIRKYYADRILISMLKNKTVSEFRRKLY